MKENSQNQKKKIEHCEDFQYTEIPFFWDGMNTGTKNNPSISTKKTVDDITISSVNHEEVNPYS